MTAFHDIIIVGGGSAGCVLASRLSERSTCSVLLLESGADIKPGDEPADIRDVFPLSSYNPAYKQGLKGYWRTRETSPEITMEVGHVIGGGSSVMGMVALRGTADDYDEWAALGAHGWGWADVLPFFRRLETDLDFQGDQHGARGPTTIRRHREDQWPPLARAAHDYAMQRQMPHIADMNTDFRDGHGAVPMASSPSRRSSSAMGYLDAEVRRRGNLTVLGGARVTALSFENGRAMGVRARVDGAPAEFRAGEVILAAGALHSPQLLLRAGIGPAAELAALGIAPRSDLPGVGGNLQNHAALYLGAYLRRSARQPAALRSHQNTSLRYSSGVAGCPRTDMYMWIQSKSAWHAIGARLATLGTALLKPASRGHIALQSADPSVPPLIEYNFLSDERDMTRLIGGFRDVVNLVLSPELRPLCHRPFPVRRTDALRLLNRRSRGNAVKTWAVATLLDMAPWLSDAVFAMLIDGDTDLRALAGHCDALVAHIEASISGQAHQVGTCRMGARDDRGAVVDSAGRVFGVEGLRVADASVMPTVPRGNTNTPTLMVAEKLAASIAER